MIVLKFLNDEIFDHYSNFTYIALIFKVNNSINILDFRPISLYNVIYKLVLKVLINRLKQILPHIISNNQSVFMPRCLITDDIIVAYETLHFMKTRQKLHKGSMTVKLDISKAYNKLEWIFLEAIMRRLGFDEEWISKVMTCVTMVTFAVLVNSQPGQKIIPIRGLRQSDLIF